MPYLFRWRDALCKVVSAFPLLALSASRLLALFSLHFRGYWSGMALGFSNKPSQGRWTAYDEKMRQRHGMQATLQTRPRGRSTEED
ncbi:hypothetical protein OE88DRAFT_145358 [Heliocybe sulcata]|uniref:Uncharacterized protein n=1 Tax=Heliocybe sulcata TaxID=5364 RepID=A0A5C3NJF9_9AGAM|nr:hypothetical protein OE88DRAFT_145358 [Heliocybe sulcata]